MANILEEYGVEDSDSSAIKIALQNIVSRLDLMQNDIDFVKNHMSNYLGDGVGMTHLIDETAIYFKSPDFG